MTASNDKALAAVVEHMGVWFSTLGVPRSAGQLFGYMLACDPAEQSAGQIADGIGMSRASVSSSARLLLQMRALEERHRVGDRKTYYRLRTNWWIEMATAKLSGFAQLADMGRRTKAAGDLARTDGLDEMIAFSEFWQSEIPNLTKRWEQHWKEQREER